MRVTYPTSNIPAPNLGAPNEPTINGRPANAWDLLGAATASRRSRCRRDSRRRFTTASSIDAAKGGTRLVGPIEATLPVGIDFLARPFDEPTLLRIAAAYEAATHHRKPPPGFGPVKDLSAAATE